MTARIDRDAARNLFDCFTPMLSYLENKGVEYCLVGGLAVMAQALKVGEERVRATQDADLLLPEEFSNASFARAYLDVYACAPQNAETVYRALFGNEGMDDALEYGEDAFLNMAFIGASAEIDDVETPDFDVCRQLNQRTLRTVARERIAVFGNELWVATVDELIGMKQDTIALLKASAAETTRPQDYEDIATLKRITMSGTALKPDESGLKLVDRLRTLLRGEK